MPQSPRPSGSAPEFAFSPRTPRHVSSDAASDEPEALTSDIIDAEPVDAHDARLPDGVTELHRDAITGQIVSRAYADEHPDTTVTDRIDHRERNTLRSALATIHALAAARLTGVDTSGMLSVDQRALVEIRRLSGGG